MRLFFILMLIITVAGCASLSKPLAPILNVPPKPLLKKSIYQVSYSTPQSPARVKSVQLPAHPLKKGDTVRIVPKSDVSVTQALKNAIQSSLEAQELKVVTDGEAAYTLTINKLLLDFGPESLYKLDIPKSPQGYIEDLINRTPAFKCANIVASVGMRLTHNTSSDVVWFAQSSIDSASFQGLPLQFSFSQVEKIANDYEVATFIANQNTKEARMQRADTEIEVPEYKIELITSPLKKVAGACSETEVSAITLNMQNKLASDLIDKLTVR